jgi:23S rRNA (pseudouridine1915-N3)-methyltransferase
MEIILRAIGQQRDRAMLAICAEYHKRLHWPFKIEELVVKKSGPPAVITRLEGELLLDKLPADAYLYVLDERGRQMTSLEFSQHLEDIVSTDSKRKVYFLLGGSNGHSDSVKARADCLLSLGKMTMPHQLARLVLIEQIYRAQTISQGHPYHK